LGNRVPGTGRVIKILPVCNKKTNLEIEGLVKTYLPVTPTPGRLLFFGFCLADRALEGGFQSYLSVGGQF
jgi:hypothetical protein